MAEKRSGLKIALIIIGIVVVGGVLVTGVCIFSIYRAAEESAPAFREAGQRGQNAAREFAAAHSQSECMDEGFTRHDACGTGMAIMCRTEARIFADECLRQATPTPGICEGVAPPTEIMAGARWAQQYCVDHGRANDQQCPNFARALVDYCGRVQ